MIVFEVSLNGKLLARVGQEDVSVLSAIVSAAGALGPASTGTIAGQTEQELHLHAGGLSCEKDGMEGVHLNWVEEALSIGDEITVRLVDSEKADEPKPHWSREQFAASKKTHGGRQRDYYERAKEVYFMLRDKYEPGAAEGKGS
ncbi:MAG: hypothetical protein GY851_07415 [bacterium]|nr:hypothetical protein [bacterium]